MLWFKFTEMANKDQSELLKKRCFSSLSYGEICGFEVNGREQQINLRFVN